MQIEKVADGIKSTERAHKLIVIGIEGFGGSGKTTLASKLAELLGDAFVVGIDDFIVKEKITEQSWDRGPFDRKRLERQVLIPATTNQPVKYQKLMWQTNTLSDWVEVPAVEYLIVEGISVYHPNIAKYYDYKIWIDTPLETAKQRGHARDGSNENAQHWDLWAENDRKYQQKYHPELVADFTIETSDMHAYLIILEITPLTIGKTYTSLPLHCTLVHWFWADIPWDDLSEHIQKIVQRTKPVRLLSGDEATFTGVTRQGAIPVMVNKVNPTKELIHLHTIVCEELDKLNIKYSAPQYVKSGFSPHVTHQGKAQLARDDLHTSTALYLVEADAPEYGNDRYVRSKIELLSTVSQGQI